MAAGTRRDDFLRHPQGDGEMPGGLGRDLVGGFKRPDAPSWDALPEWLGYRSPPGPGSPEMNVLRALVVIVVLALSACGGAEDERACVLLEDVPGQAEEATLEGVTAVAQAAQHSEVSELRALGERLAQNLMRSQVLERLAAGSFLEVVQTDLDELRRACGDLGSR